LSEKTVSKRLAWLT